MGGRPAHRRGRENNAALTFMHIHVIAVGERMPAWVEAGFDEYARRLPRSFRLTLMAVPAGRRTQGVDIDRLVRAEGERLMAATPGGAHVIALERTGRHLDTEALAHALQACMTRGVNLAFWIGGPEGLSPECLSGARERWSLSALTLAHPLVRVVLAEQLYRAWSIIQRLPYHR